MSKGKDKINSEPSVGLPRFDPNPSAQFAIDVLREINTPFALIGRIAIWALLPEEEHEFTKDIDFAVPLRAIEPLRSALIQRGIIPKDLTIGGLGVRSKTIRVDFIDRREGGLNALFEEAIKHALPPGINKATGLELPVVSPEYLVALKVVAAEEKDQKDAIRIIRALPELDLLRTRAIVFQHGGPGSANLLDVLARQAGHKQARGDYRNSG